jgi:glycosyltransferase involved in cell wall biosynthesis
MAAARIAFVVNGGSDGIMAERARSFATRLTPKFSASFHYRTGGRIASLRKMLSGLQESRPSIIYVLDLSLAGVAAAFAYRRIRRCRVVLDTGDAVAELLWSTGRVGPAGKTVLQRYEDAVLRAVDTVIVRGSYHREHLQERGIAVAAVIHDGVALDRFRPFDVGSLRAALEVQGVMTVGVLGSLRWNQRLGWTAGQELVQALAMAGSSKTVGLIVGSGTGLSRLRETVERSGVADRVRFVGQVPAARVPEYINCMDVCLSTQTNDLVGRVRTTAKLPEFLACGRFVLASRVGEAARLLPDEMLVDYGPGFDAQYPQRLAARIEALEAEPSRLLMGERGRGIAEREFDYDVLSARLTAVLG